MKQKVILMFLLTSILSLTIISAATNFTLSKSSLSFINPDNSETFTITSTNVNSTTYTFITPVIADVDGVTIPITVTPSPATTTGIIPTTITVNSTINYDKLLIGKTYTGDLKVINNNAEEAIVGLKFTKTFCSSGEKGEEVNGKLELTDVSIDNSDGDNTEWSPLDPIKIDVKVENTGDDKLSDVIVELGLYNSKGKNIVNDLKDLDDEQIKLGSIREGDDDIVIFEFKVPADFADETYTLVVKAYSDDLGEDEVCTSYSSDISKDYYELIDGVRETDEEKHIIVDNIKISPVNPQCSEIVQVSAEVFNIGDEDYEDQVRVTLFNKELGINLEQVIRQDFDQGDSESVDFEFEIPANAIKRTYVLEFKTYYDYDTDDEDYNLVSDKKITQTLTLEGNCEPVISAPSIKITAKLSSETPEAVAGEQVIITATLENTGESTDLYTISVSGNTAWSSLNQINPESVILPAGESKKVEILLVLDTAASGDKEFTIKATKDGKTVEQRVALSITTKKTSSGITGATITEHLKANGFIYAIVLINLILIIAIILVIRRMVSPKSSM